MVWKKLKKTSFGTAIAFLKKRENYCVNAISRFNSGETGNIWAAYEQNAKPGSAEIKALLLYGKRLLFPVFDFSSAEPETNFMPLPYFFSIFMKSDSLHSAQGLSSDMTILEKTLRKKGIFSSVSYDYELRSLENEAADNAVSSYIPPGGLVVRRAAMRDAGALFPLQAGYETEEVLPVGAAFNPAACRKVLESLIADNLIFTAELNGCLVGKININARSFNRLQIGGVYVQPEYRRQGIALAMTAGLIRELAPQKKGFTLFVKKANIPARKVYDRLGFEKIGDYRISYYE